MPRRTPDVVVLNGGSSSGKSSIARALQERLPGLGFTVGIDTFVEAREAQRTDPDNPDFATSGGVTPPEVAKSWVERGQTS